MKRRVAPTVLLLFVILLAVTAYAHSDSSNHYLTREYIEGYENMTEEDIQYHLDMFDFGYEYGYDDGFWEGHEGAYDEGYDKGYNEGYDEGYNEGYDAYKQENYIPNMTTGYYVSGKTLSNIITITLTVLIIIICIIYRIIKQMNSN